MSVELPKRVTNSWIQEEAPKCSTQAEAQEFLTALHQRGWTPDDLDERVTPYLDEKLRKTAADHRSKVEGEKVAKAKEKEEARAAAAAEREKAAAAAKAAKATTGKADNGGATPAQGGSKAALEDLAASK